MCVCVCVCVIVVVVGGAGDGGGGGSGGSSLLFHRLTYFERELTLNICLPCKSFPLFLLPLIHQ